MPQELTMPIASPRSGGFQPGNEVTVGGQTFTVVGTNQDGLPLLAPKSGFREDTPAAAPKAPASTRGGNPLANLMAKRERIAALPENVRGVVIDRLFDKAISPRIPKAMNDEQKGQIRKNFENAILGRSPEMASITPSEADFKRMGMPTGAGGKVQEGVMSGLGNITTLLDATTSDISENWNPFQGDKVSNKSLSDLITGKKPDDSSLATRKLLESAGALHESTSAYAGRHPYKAGAAEFGGQLLPAIPLEMLMPGTPPGASLGTKALVGVGKGSLGMIPFDPSPKGIATGAAFGAGSPILGKAFGKVKSALLPAKAATKVAPAAAAAVTGAAEGSEAKLEALAQKAFGKPLKELSPDQKIELVNKWRDESVAAAKTEKAAARKAAEQAKVDAVTKKATEKIDQRVATRKAMDEAKALQKKISAFIKENKRAPNEEELLKMKSEPVSTSLPADLTGSKPRYGYGSKNFQLNFEDPKDLALYTIAQDTKNAAHDRFISFLKEQFPGKNEQEIVSMGKSVRERIKGLAKDGDPSQPLTIPKDEGRGAGLAARGDKGSVIPERGKAITISEQVERRQLPRSTRAQLYTSELSQIRKDIVGAASPEEKTYHEQRLAVKMDEYKKAMETPLADQFRVESPEAIKAVSAVADVSKVVSEIKPKAPEVQVIPEGQHGAGALGKKAKDAERVAAARAKAMREQPEPVAAGTPESALLAKEEEFLTLTDQIEAMGPKGKEAAKNLNAFRRKGTITMDQAIEMGNKVLEMMKKGTVPQ